MNVDNPVASDRELARLLQMGVVLEEVVEARASKHHEALAEGEDGADGAVRSLLEEASEESAEHRRRLEDLIERLDADTVPFERIQRLVEERYGEAPPGSFDDILYDQLHGEESAYKFYDDLIGAVEDSDATFDLDREHLLATLADIREEEAEGVREVTELMSHEP